MSEQDINSKILITKVKLNNDDTAHIEYKKSDNLGAGSTSWDGEEKVTEEFKDTFLNCKEGFLGCIPILDSKKKDITMNCIKFGYGKTSDKIENALYSVKYNFHEATNAVVNISTPQLPIYKEGFDEKTFCIAGQHEKALYKVTELAVKYLNGETRTEQKKCVKKDENGNVVIDFKGKE